jgi:hypothetical protein
LTLIHPKYIHADIFKTLIVGMRSLPRLSNHRQKPLLHEHNEPMTTGGEQTCAAEASSVTGMPMTPYMWRMPREASARATTVYPFASGPAHVYLLPKASYD